MRGFTLIEILLTVTLLTVLVGVSLPLYRNFVLRTDLTVARDSIFASVSAARQRSQYNIADGGWGVYVTAGSIVLFQGDSYASRDTEYDDVIAIADSVNISDDNEFVFDQLTGEVDQTGSITLTSLSDRSVTIFINDQGIPDAQ